MHRLLVVCSRWRAACKQTLALSPKCLDKIARLDVDIRIVRIAVLTVERESNEINYNLSKLVGPLDARFNKIIKAGKFLASRYDNRLANAKHKRT